MYPPNKYDFDPELRTPLGCLKMCLRATLFLFIVVLLFWLMNRFL